MVVNLRDLSDVTFSESISLNRITVQKMWNSGDERLVLEKLSFLIWCVPDFCDFRAPISCRTTGRRALFGWLPSGSSATCCDTSAISARPTRISPSLPDCMRSCRHGVSLQSSTGRPQPSHAPLLFSKQPYKTCPSPQALCISKPRA
jgi:hypothetical protein